LPGAARTEGDDAMTTTAEYAALRRRIYQLELEHRDATHAYIKTKRAEHRRRMAEISRQLAALRNGGASNG